MEKKQSITQRLCQASGYIAFHRKREGIPSPRSCASIMDGQKASLNGIEAESILINLGCFKKK